MNQNCEYFQFCPISPSCRTVISWSWFLRNLSPPITCKSLGKRNSGLAAIRSQTSFYLHYRVQRWICVGWKLLGMRKMVATFYCGWLTSSPFLFQDWNGKVAEECSIHFAHTQQFSSNGNLTLFISLVVFFRSFCVAQDSFICTTYITYETRVWIERVLNYTHGWRTL